MKWVRSSTNVVVVNPSTKEVYTFDWNQPPASAPPALTLNPLTFDPNQGGPWNFKGRFIDLPNSKNMIVIPANNHLLFLRIGDQFESYWVKPSEDIANNHEMITIYMSDNEQYIGAVSRSPTNQIYFSSYARQEKGDGSCIKIDVLSPASEQCIHCLNPANPRLNLDHTCGNTCLEGSFMLDNERCPACVQLGCRLCTQTTCTDCYEPKFLHQNECHDPCPDTFYGNIGPPRACLACSAPCANCLSPTYCMSCLNGSHYVE